MSDNSSEFSSTLLKTFADEFSFSQIQTSAYHPATNGFIERFHATMKNMMRFLSEEFPDAWDETLPWVLFAYREVPVETLGFSPLELMFGRQVNGPFAHVKKSWLNHCPTQIKFTKKSVMEFVLYLRERLRVSIMSANKCAENAKRKSKVWYDNKAKMRSFKPGDEVLALLPYKSNSFQAMFFDRYKVLEKLGPIDYRIDTSGRKKLNESVTAIFLNHIFVEMRNYFHILMTRMKIHLWHNLYWLLLVLFMIVMILVPLFRLLVI